MKTLWHNLYLYRLKPLRAVPPSVRASVARAARGGRAARRWWWALAIVMGTMLFAAQVAIGSYVVHWCIWKEFPETYQNVLEDVLEDEYLWVYSIAWAIAAAATLPELVLVRLVWLRLGAKHALRRRERCASCGHGLRGVPISTDGIVTCPECAAGTPAVAEWGEIDGAASERTVFAPASGLVRNFWTRRRLILAAKAGAVLALFAALGYGGWWGIREINIRRQAAIARNDRADVAAINARLREGVPLPEPGQVTVAALLREIAAKARAVQREFWDTHGAETATLGMYMPDPSSITFRSSTDDDPVKAERGRHLSRQLLDLMKDEGLFELIDQLPAASPWRERAFTPIESGSPALDFSNTRNVFRICLARMKLAWEAGDVSAFRTAMDAALAILQAIEDDPFLLDWLIAIASNEMLLQAFTMVLLEQPEGQWLDVLERGYAGLRWPSAQKALEYERIFLLDTLAWYFSDPRRVRAGADAPELALLGIDGQFSFVALFGGTVDDTPRRFGTYVENRDAATAYFAALLEHSKVDVVARGALTESVPEGSDLLIVNHFIPVMREALVSADRAELRRRAVLVMLALERYRLAHGAYPDSLAELPADSAAAQVVDPFSGKAFGYRRIDPTADAFGRGYLLWTVGLDGEDNGGKAQPELWLAALRPIGKGQDMILNDPKW